MKVVIKSIAITICAVIAGADDWTGIADSRKAKEEWSINQFCSPLHLPSCQIKQRPLLKS